MYRKILELDIEWIKSLPISKQLEYVHQNPKYHREGNVLNHTILVLKEADKIAKRENLSPEDREILLLSAFLHDVGKIKKRSHEVWSYMMAEEILYSLGYHDKERIQTIKKLVLYHQAFKWIKKPNKVLAKLTPRERYLLSLLVEADCKGRISEDLSCLNIVEELKKKIASLNESQGLIEEMHINAIVLGFKPCDIRTFITEPITEMIQEYEQGKIDEVQFFKKVKEYYQRTKEKLHHSKERFQEALKGDWTKLIEFKLPPDAKPFVKKTKKGNKGKELEVRIDGGWITHTKPIVLNRGQGVVILRFPMRLKVGDYIKTSSLRTGAETMRLIANIWNPIGQLALYQKYKHKISKKHFDNFLKLLQTLFKEFSPFKDAWSYTIDGGYKIDPASTYINASLYLPIIFDLDIAESEVEKARGLIFKNVSEILKKHSFKDLEALAKRQKQEQVIQRGMGVIDALNNKDYYAKLITQGITKAASAGLISTSLATSILNIANPILTLIAIYQITGEVVKMFAGNIEILRNQEPEILDVVINPAGPKEKGETFTKGEEPLQKTGEEKKEGQQITTQERKQVIFPEERKRKGEPWVALFSIAVLSLVIVSFYFLANKNITINKAKTPARAK